MVQAGAGRMRVYIAAPYTQGSEGENVRRAIEAADQVIAAGHAPFVPHLCHFWHLMSPHAYETWLRIDMEWLRASDAMVRLPGPSAGADMEEAEARRTGIPVYGSVAELSSSNGI